MFFLYIWGDRYKGCDHTISCNEKFMKLPDELLNLSEVKSYLVETNLCNYKDLCEEEKLRCMIYQVERYELLDLDQLFSEERMKREELNRQITEEEELNELRRLKAKYGDK